MVKQSIALGSQKTHAGNWKPVAATLHHATDGAEAAENILQREVLAARWSQQREYEQLIQVEF